MSFVKLRIFNNYNLICYLLMIFIMIAACQRIKETHFPDGTIKSKQEFKGDKENGISTWYYNNGSKELEINYKDGLPDGVSTRWYYNGQKELQENYKDGKKNGSSVRWDNQGRIIEEITFKNDSLHGLYTQYYENGNVKIEGCYFMGKYDSTWTYYDISGMKVGDGSYVKGSGTQKAYYPGGRIRLVVSYTNNKRNGYVISYDKQGNEIKRVLYKNDIPVSQ